MHGLAGGLHPLSEFGEPGGSGRAGCPFFKGNGRRWFCWAPAGGSLSHPGACRRCCSQPDRLGPGRGRGTQGQEPSWIDAQASEMVKTSCGAQQTAGSSFLGSRVTEY